MFFNHIMKPYQNILQHFIGSHSGKRWYKFSFVPFLPTGHKNVISKMFNHENKCKSTTFLEKEVSMKHVKKKMYKGEGGGRGGRWVWLGWGGGMGRKCRQL